CRAAAALAGGSLAQLVRAEQRPGLDAAIRGLLAGPDGSCEIGSWREVRGLRADGTSFPLLASVSKTTVLGQPMLCAIMRDMTDIADREQRLTELASERERLLRLSEQASRAKSKFLAVMSHELRTPLNAIIGFSEAMATGALGPAGSPQHREYTTDILKSGRHLLAIINDILDLTRIQERGVSMQVEPIAPALAFEDAWLFVKGRATDKGLAVSLQDDTAGATVLCDERALRQMLINLLGNAVKFTPAGGRITVTLQVPPDTGTMTIEIADTGPGVSPAVLQHLGQPFVQDRDSYQADNPGTGLGLAIVAETAAAMQGRVSFRNRPEGGFCACLALPAATG
uniref:sensor histidine kinase n=1 Tax=Ferrovibrio sp. TaxID=1917215 RepID=UPI00311E3DA0